MTDCCPRGPPQTLTIGRTAEASGVSTRTIRRLIEQGVLTAAAHRARSAYAQWELKLVKSRKSAHTTLPRLLTVPEFAEALSMSERTVWRWIEADEIKPYRLGRAVRIAEDEVARLLRKRRRR